MESNNSTEILRESVFFTARPAPPPSHRAADPASASTSSPCGYYSPRIRTLMEHMRESGMSEADAEMEASRVHWTEVDEEYCTALATSAGEESESSTQSEGMRTELGMTEAERVKLYEENVEAMRKLQRDNPESDFFQIDEKEVELGTKIGEGGQATIHEFQTQSSDGTVYRWARKVFKAGYLVQDLQKQWPLGLLHKFSPANANVKEHLWNPMLHGRLLRDGRFAFDMMRWWGDLRKLLDLRMRQNGNQHPPFMKADGNYDECCMLIIILFIAMGMKDMHKEGTLHRDLKASNVLIESNNAYFKERKTDLQMDPIELKHDFGCLITDYECSIGVMGTRFWRAPEILEALKKRTVYTTVNLFTEKSDIYSFAMTCYEILTGYTPFEDIEEKGEMSIDDVLEGKRPRLPSYLRTWMKELLEKCWDRDPLKRPTFDEVVNIFVGILSSDLGCKSESEFFKFH